MTDALQKMIRVEVAYAAPLTQTIMSLSVELGTTALQAVELSGIVQQHPEIATRPLVLGIFGKRVPNATILKAMDRVEIYRPLLANPKEARRQRAASKNSKP